MAKIDKLIQEYGVSKTTANRLNDIDPTASKKYLSWLFKMKYVNVNGKYLAKGTLTTTKYEDVNRLLVWLEKNLNNPNLDVKYKDINYFKDVKTFIDTIDPLTIPTKSEIKKQVDKVFEDDRFLIIVPKTFDASKLYGMGTKWCTTQKTYYNSYTKNGILFYIIDKSIDRKFGCSVKLFNRQMGYSLTFYNNEDKNIPSSTIIQIYGDKVYDLIYKNMSEYYSVEYIKIKKKEVLEQSIKSINKIKKDLSSVGLSNDKLESLLSDLMGDEVSLEPEGPKIVSLPF